VESIRLASILGESYIMIRNNVLQLNKIIHQVSNLLDKFRSFESVCGAGLIHDTSEWVCILANWQRNFEYYVKHPEKITLHDWSKHPVQKYTPTQEQLDTYFSNLLDKAEMFLVDNVKKG
jgi:hypothetical protein